MTTSKPSPIKKLHITEKTSLLADGNAYSFQVTKDATKAQIAKEIKALYNVVPVKVNIVNAKPKRVVSRGKVGQTASIKKAYVFLKKGDTIDIA
jgi:large subunit ribosomal protein L23